jgi:hypothetical protein
MKKLIQTVAVALLVAPVLALNAANVTDRAAASVAPPSHTVAGTCYIYFAGRWIGYPC